MSVVLITGCSSGFGLLSAVELASRGHRVFATMRDTGRSGPLLEAASQVDADLEVLQLDVTDRASIDEAIGSAIERAGTLDVVVNNAGIAHGAPVEEIDLGEFGEVIETNVFGPLRVIQAALPVMRSQRRGHIVNVTSLAAFVSPPFLGVYAASKHAMDALGEALASEVAPFGIHVTNVAPAAYETPMIASVSTARSRVDSSSPYESRIKTLLDRHEHSMRQNNDPGEVARAVADAIAADPPPARVVVPATSAFIVTARGATPPEELRALVAQSYGI